MEREDKKVSDKDMGMTNKQFQGFIRLIINAVETATQHIEPSNEKAREAFDNVLNILQSMLEDGN